MPVLITVLETDFEDPDHVVTAERKLQALKLTHYDVSTYNAEFQRYATNVQWNDPAKHTPLMRYLNNEIKKAPALSNNFSPQFQEFVAFLQ
jgi:hypothetical protein